MASALSTRGCDATYRGYLAATPKRRERELGGDMLSARIGVPMAAADVAAEERDEMTEWVNVLVFSPKLIQRLDGAPKGTPIAVIGSVDKKIYETRTGETHIDRTIVADDLLLGSDAQPMPESGPEDLPVVPGSIPRGCDATYRGHLADDPRHVTKDSGAEMTVARIGVNMATGELSDKDRDELTEWVNVKVFDAAQRRRLARCRKGQLVVVSGGVTKRSYHHPTTGELRIDRSIVGEYVRSAGASLAPPKNDTEAGGEEKPSGPGIAAPPQ